MNKKEMQKVVNDIKSNLKFFDSVVHWEYDKNVKFYVNEKQAKAVQKMLDLLESISWQLALDSTKKTIVDGEFDVIRTDRKTGSPVKVRPCGEEYKGKTYFGILIGDVALSISESINKDDPNTLHIGRSFYNPAIFIPELKKVVYGCESWWDKIETEEELKEVITDETIKNTWYVKMLTS